MSRAESERLPEVSVGSHMHRHYRSRGGMWLGLMRKIIPCILRIGIQDDTIILGNKQRYEY